MNVVFTENCLKISGIDPLLGTFVLIARCVFICHRKKRLYLGSLNTCDAHLEEPTVCFISPLKPELNPICYLLALLGAHHFLHVSRIRVKLLTLGY
jgi:hypothetical protein